MRRTLAICLVLATLMSCSKDESGVSSGNLSTCLIKYLFFKDEISYFSYQNLDYLNDKVCSYTWQRGCISRINGGFYPFATGTNLCNFRFSATAACDSIIAGNNIFRVFHIIFDPAGQVFSRDSLPLTYYLDGSNRLVKVFDDVSANPAGDTIRFVYSGDQITEIVNGTWTRRQFYMNNNNLVRVVKDNYDGAGARISRYEILFTDYDSHPNPFRGKYYVTGAFFRAFSENNYQGFTVNQYEQWADTLRLINTWHSYAQLAYFSSGYPDFGK